ncbi:YhfZ family protein [Glycomyces tenuis]|uniref:YhfZ family protein n=1 Tax=Glycomyces tenuis TaxID=58116 RepID=UPI0003F919A6|nr:YhfZ family protein [Glycomyces tenuis]
MTNRFALSKHGLGSAVRAITVDALAGGPGVALPTNLQYQTQHGFTAGTLQRALNHLRESNAVGVVSRGHLGRFVEWVNLREAWYEAGLDPVQLLVPPTGLIEMDVLAEMFAETLTQNGIAHAIKHAHGGHTRIFAAATGATDIAVVSKATIDLVSSMGTVAAGSLTQELAPGTFYAPARVMVVRRSGEGDRHPRVIAIDRNSPDHVVLTQAEFPPQHHTYVDITFPRTLAWVRTGKVDAAIWHMTTTDVPISLAGFELTPLHSTSPATAGADQSRAVLVSAPHRPELSTVIRQLPLSDLLSKQTEEIEAETARHKEFLAETSRSDGQPAH